MLTEKLAADISKAVESKMAEKTAVNWRRGAELAALGLSGTILANSLVTEDARDAGTIAGGYAEDGTDLIGKKSALRRNEEALLSNPSMPASGFYSPHSDAVSTVRAVNAGTRAYNALVREDRAAKSRLSHPLILGLPSRVWGEMEGLGYGPVGIHDRGLAAIRAL